MIDNIIHNIYKIAGPVLAAFLGGYIVWRYRRRKKAAEAAVEFRDKVLAEIKGLYPIPRHLDKDVSYKFKKSIPAVRQAAADFRSFIPWGSRSSFDAALKKYCDHCSVLTWEQCVTYNLVPRKPDDIGPKEVFRQNVNDLLSFTKNN